MYRNVNGQHHDYYYLGGKLVANKKHTTTTYLHSDYLGSTAAESNASGFVTSRMYYQPFGEKIGTPKDDVGYTGHKFDTDLGLSYMQARYYDPVIGRFYSNDAMQSIAHLAKGNLNGFNRYTYANNNPYKYVDPDGREGVDSRLKARTDAMLNGQVSSDEFRAQNMADGVGGVAAIGGGAAGFWRLSVKAAPAVLAIFINKDAVFALLSIMTANVERLGGGDIGGDFTPKTGKQGGRDVRREIERENEPPPLEQKVKPTDPDKKKNKAIGGSIRKDYMDKPSKK